MESLSKKRETIERLSTLLTPFIIVRRINVNKPHRKFMNEYCFEEGYPQWGLLFMKDFSKTRESHPFSSKILLIFQLANKLKLGNYSNTELELFVNYQK